MTPQELMDSFSYLINWEDKYRYLIELGEKLRDFPEADKTDANQVGFEGKSTAKIPHCQNFGIKKTKKRAFCPLSYL